MNVFQGPDELVDTCFRRSMAGFGAFTVRVSVAVFPVLVTPEMIVETAPLVLT